jgi:hypothetical protein
VAQQKLEARLGLVATGKAIQRMTDHCVRRYFGRTLADVRRHGVGSHETTGFGTKSMVPRPIYSAGFWFAPALHVQRLTVNMAAIPF